MLLGSGRLLRAALSALALALLAAGCVVQKIDDIPAYPGSARGPGYRHKEGRTTSLKQIYHTPAKYADVIQFYREYVAREPGWEGAPTAEMTVWSKNMQLDSLMATAVPIDSTRPGKLILVVNEHNRVTIRAFSSHPAT
jgi:hypothetical protein